MRNRNSIAYMPQEIVYAQEQTVYEYFLETIQSWEEYKIYPMVEELNLTIDIHQTVKSLS